MIGNKIGALLITGFFLLTLHAQSSADKSKLQKQPLKRIVIDPGHGGKASVAGKFYGASGKHMEEKDVALAVGLKLRDALREEMPDVEIPCVQCKEIFTFTEKEQENFYQRNMTYHDSLLADLKLV